MSQYNRTWTRATYFRRQQEAETKVIEAESAKRVEEAIRKKVHDALHSEDFKKEMELKIQEGRKKIIDDIAAQLEREKEEALAEARRKEEEKKKEKEQLEQMLEENRRKIEEAQRRAAEEQARKEEERYRELEALQRQKEETLRRKRLEEEQGRAEQMKILGKKNTRPKLSFALGFK
jgi:arginine/glutamate-rich protein 1